MTGLVYEHGQWRALVLPEAGGVIARLDHGAVPVLCAIPEGARSPLAAACFAMVPWCDRIARGRFVWADTMVAVTPNFPPERHAIHGHG